MSTTTATSGVAPAWLPSDHASLLLLPMERVSAALNPAVATKLMTGAHTVEIPMVTQDGSATWTAEASTIAESDPGFASASCTPSALKALVSVSNETIADANPAVAQVIGDGLARDMAKKLDKAFVGNTVTNGPSGLLSVTGAQTLAAGTAYSDIAWIAEAASMLDAEDAQATGVMVSPQTMLALTKLTDEDGSRRPLLAPSAHDATVMTAHGLPIVVNSQLTGSTSYVVDASRIYTVVRQDVTIEMSDQVLFAKDMSMIRAVARFGFVFAHPESIVKVDLGA